MIGNRRRLSERLRRLQIGWVRLAIVAALWPALALAAEDPCLEVHAEPIPDGVTLRATLRNCTEVTITVRAELENATSSVPLPLTADSAGRTQLTLATLKREDLSKPWHYSWHYAWKLGRRLGGIPQAFEYLLPYRNGSYLVTQGAHGAFSHGPGSGDEEAIDWAMPLGTKVYPIRPGTVAALRDDCTRGGTEPEFRTTYNYVVLMHDDGTFAEYVHLQALGVLVRLGQHVSTEDPIGLSGNTGFSTEPHLHVALFSTIDGHTRTTHPLQFTINGRSVRLEQGARY